jgi:hypothetical protein
MGIVANVLKPIRAGLRFVFSPVKRLMKRILKPIYHRFRNFVIRFLKLNTLHPVDHHTHHELNVLRERLASAEGQINELRTALRSYQLNQFAVGRRLAEFEDQNMSKKLKAA